MSSIVKALSPLLKLLPPDSLHDVIMQQIVNVAKKRSGSDYWATPNEFINKLRSSDDFNKLLDKAKITDDEIRDKLKNL